MGKNRYMILMMSCNQPLYLEEERACRDTFLRDAEASGVPYYFYRGGEDSQYISQDHVIHLSCDDTLAGTSEKTVIAMATALNFPDWDYLVKTNVSTYLNIGRINTMMDNLEGPADHNIYGARYLINKYSKNIPFPRGHFSIFSRTMVEAIVKWSRMLLHDDSFPKTDDTLIGLSCLYQVMKIYEEKIQDKIMEVPAVNEWPSDGSLEDSPEISEALCIRCKDETDKENTTKNMMRAHELLHAPVMGWKRKGYRQTKLFETGYGLTTYEAYMKLSIIFDKLKEMKDTS